MSTAKLASLILVVAASAVGPVTVFADSPAQRGDRNHPVVQRTAQRDWHVGANFRTDFGTHPLRVDGGVSWRNLDVILVLDPMFWIDGQHDLDLLVSRRFSGKSAWSILAGWRTTTISLAGGQHWQQRSVLGVAAHLPRLSSRVRARFGLELTTLWVKHGAGLPTETIAFRRDIVDLFNLGLFLRLEYASPL